MPAMTKENIEAMGYTHVRQRGDGGWCGLLKLLYTTALVTEISWVGYEDRWCYSSVEKAEKALDQWADDETEPMGWHRHPSTGRRIDEHGHMTINF